ncbi:Hsp70 family protein, partial [Thermoproteota archaeon]
MLLLGMCMIKYGFDFGTSNSAVSFTDGERVELIPIEPSSETPTIMPSFWYFSYEGEWFLGQDALNEYREAGEGRFMRSLKSVIADPTYKGSIFNGSFVKIDSMIEMFFREIKSRCDEYIGESVESVVIGRPVRFSGSDDSLAVKRIMASAKRVGYKDVKLMYEPLGASYTLKKEIDEPSIIFTLDLGGGTTDISIVRLHPEVGEDEVLASHGTYIGGNNFNSAIMREKLLAYFGVGTTFQADIDKRQEVPAAFLDQVTDWYLAYRLAYNKEFESIMNRISNRNSHPEKIEALEQLIYEQLGLDVFEAVEEAKKDLSDNDDSLILYQEEKIDIEEAINRPEFEGIIKRQTDEIQRIMSEALEKAGLKRDDIDISLLVGGTSKVPLFKRIITDMFPKSKLYKSDDFTSVAYGLEVDVKIPSNTWTFKTKETFQLIGITFLCEFLRGDLVLSDEHEHAEWMTVEQIKSGEFPPWFVREFERAEAAKKV